jgi:hypothetical protein
MTYGFDAGHLMVWIDSFDRVATGHSGVLCRRHADAMVVPHGWMLDDRRDPVPRLFKSPQPSVAAAPRAKRAPVRQRHNDAEQLELGAEAAVVAVDDDEDELEPVDEELVAGADPVEVQPWKPTFDQTDDLNGLLEARGPLLSRAFGGQDRRRPTR